MGLLIIHSLECFPTLEQRSDLFLPAFASKQFDGTKDQKERKKTRKKDETKEKTLTNLFEIELLFYTSHKSMAQFPKQYISMQLLTIMHGRAFSMQPAFLKATSISFAWRNISAPMSFQIIVGRVHMSRGLVFIYI